MRMSWGPRPRPGSGQAGRALGQLIDAQVPAFVETHLEVAIAAGRIGVHHGSGVALHVRTVLDLRHPPGHARLPGRRAAGLPARCCRLRDAVPGGRHHRRLAAAAQLVLAAGAQRRGAEDPAQGAQGHARGLRAGQPRRVRAALRQHNFGGVDVVEDCVHVTADGRRLWVTHGDLFDGVIQCAKWLATSATWPTSSRSRSTAGSTARARGWACRTGACRAT
jgi:hypothetical protein